MEKKDTLSDIMQSVREWTEEQSAFLGFPTDMTGMCAASSAELFTRMTELGYDCRLAVNDRHAFVLYGTSVLDVTASQFGKPDICLAKVGSEEYWKADRTFECIEDFENHLSGWDVPVTSSDRKGTATREPRRES
jgi:hypothetical protein